MIEVSLINGENMRVEGARIHIKGYEQFAFYAVPRVHSNFKIADDQWDVVEESSGLCITLDSDVWRSIDSAAESAARVLRKHVPPEQLAAAIKSRVEALKRAPLALSQKRA